LDVQPKYSWAVTFRTFTAPKAEYSSLSNVASAHVGHEMPGLTVVASGAFDSLDASFSKLLAAEEAPKPARQKISHQGPVRTTEPAVLPEVIVNIGDKVRRVAAERT